MKTLDEVIKMLEDAIDATDADCPMMTLFEGNAMDVLHYLKDYRMLAADVAEKRKELEAEKDRYQEAVKNCEAAENKYLKLAQNLGEVGNPPLTWDELREMEGKPVWVEHKYYKTWLIVKDVYEETIVLDGNGFYTQYFSDDNEKETRWQAYRKERG